MSVKYSYIDILEREKLLQNKLTSRGQSIRPLVIEKIAAQIQVNFHTKLSKTKNVVIY